MPRLIDADALAETLGITDMSCERCAWHDRTKSLCRRGGDFADACFMIEAAPTVEERKVGKWTMDGFCTVCGEEAITEWNDCGGELAFTKYCPNCGARMEE